MWSQPAFLLWHSNKTYFDWLVSQSLFFVGDQPKVLIALLTDAFLHHVADIPDLVLEIVTFEVSEDDLSLFVPEIANREEHVGEEYERGGVFHIRKHLIRVT